MALHALLRGILAREPSLFLVDAGRIHNGLIGCSPHEAWLPSELAHRRFIRRAFTRESYNASSTGGPVFTNPTGRPAVG